MTFLAAFLSAVCAYLLGSLNFAIIVSNLFFHKDIRTFGSGNAGMTNILRTFGKKAAAGVLAGDVLKGFVSVCIGELLFAVLIPQVPAAYGAYTAAIFAQVGHLFPLYFKFKGGKGIAVATGSILRIAPPVIFALVGVFLLVIFCARIVSLASITVAVVYPIFNCLYFAFLCNNGLSPLANTLLGAVMSVVVLYMHRSNIRRLREGTEYRFGQKKADGQGKTGQ